MFTKTNVGNLQIFALQQFQITWVVRKAYNFFFFKLFFSIELFQNMCGELKDWINEKQSVLGNEDLGKDLRSVQALQRKHQVKTYLTTTYPNTNNTDKTIVDESSQHKT